MESKPARLPNNFAGYRLAGRGNAANSMASKPVPDYEPCRWRTIPVLMITAQRTPKSRSLGIRGGGDRLRF